MPLPEGNIAWPPEPFATAHRTIARWDAWYVGDVGSLTSTYSTPGASTRPSQYAGGLVGAASRFFWGRPAKDGQSRTRLHVPVASDLATTSADMLFSEPPRIVLPGDAKDTARKPAQARLEQIMNSPETHSTLLEAAELQAALGGTWLRVAWDTESGVEMPFLTTIPHDGAIPVWRWGRLVAVTFWTVVGRDDKTVTRHLEHHAPGRIEHGLYVGSEGQLGQRVPLADHPATEVLAGAVNADSEAITGVDGLTAAYVPNVRPSRRWRKEPALSPLGRSDFDGIEPLMDALDEVYSSWMRDVRLAKARLLVDSSAMTPLGPGQGATFDADQELFTAVPGSIGALKDGMPALAQQFAIRTREHADTAAEITRAILRAGGYSAQTFGDDSIAISTTATEVKAREKLSMRTRDKKARYWAAALAPLAHVMLELDAILFRGPAGGQDVPEVRFPPKVQEDTLELAQTAQALRAAEAASTEQIVRLVHPDWDGETVNEEVARIETERRVPDPAAFRPGIDE